MTSESPSGTERNYLRHETSCRTVVCFDIRSRFETMPPPVTVCPCCRARLKESCIPHSIAGMEFRRAGLIPFVETRLAVCPRCQWWQIRECCEECGAGCGCVTDNVVLPRPGVDDKTRGLAFNMSAGPVSWQSLLMSRSLWQVPLYMPTAVMFWLWPLRAPDQVLEV